MWRNLICTEMQSWEREEERGAETETETEKEAETLS